MCLATDTANRTLVCTVGELTNGDQYRTSDGDTMLVLFHPGDNITEEEGFTQVASLRTGVVLGVANTIKLGRDRKGRLYASRYLNNSKPDAVVDLVQASLDADADAQRRLEEQLDEARSDNLENYK